MATIVTRSGKGSPLTNTEVDANFTNLNNDKLETSAAYSHPTGNGNNHIPSNGSSGQILGYASAGTAQWQAAPSSDLVDDTSPALGGDLASNGHDVVFGDNDKAIFGADTDLEIYSDGSSSYIDEVGDGSLFLRTNGFNVFIGKTTGSEYMAVFQPDGAVSLRYDNATKFATTATGIDVTGAITVNGAALAGGASASADLYKANPSSATNPTASGTNAVSIGSEAEAAGEASLAAGFNATATAYRALALGHGADAGNTSISIGTSATSSNEGVALGRDATASGSESNALGHSSVSTATSAIAIGKSRAGATGSIAGSINQNSTTYGTTGVNTVAFGTQAKATNNSAAAIGQSSIASGYQSAAYGYNAVASGQDSFAGGPTTDATATNSTALGKGAQATHANATAVGYNAATSATNQVSLGASGYAVKVSGNYTLPTADGTNGQVMTTNGSGAVSFADAGGGADLYAANESSPAAQPSATGANAIAIGDSAVASNQDSIAIGDGANSAAYFGVAIGWGASTTSNGSRGIAIGKSATTDGISSFAAGDSARITNAGTSAVALGSSRAAGTDSFAAVISTDSSSYGATSSNSVAIGQGAKATGTNSTAIGGQFPTSSSSGSVVIGGYASQATDQQAICIGGLYSLASAYDSLAMGSYAKAAHVGKAARASGQFAAQGDAQGGQFILRKNTTDATPSVMATNQYTAGSTNQIIAASDTCITFHGTVVAMQNGAQAYGGWAIKGMLVNDGGTTSLALGNVSDMAATNASSWAVALSADNTNNALKIQVTGEASHNIRWVANVHTAEVTYA